MGDEKRKGLVAVACALGSFATCVIDAVAFPGIAAAEEVTSQPVKPEEQVGTPPASGSQPPLQTGAQESGAGSAEAGRRDDIAIRALSLAEAAIDAAKRAEAREPHDEDRPQLETRIGPAFGYRLLMDGRHRRVQGTEPIDDGETRIYLYDDIGDFAGSVVISSTVSIGAGGRLGPCILLDVLTEGPGVSVATLEGKLSGGMGAVWHPPWFDVGLSVTLDRFSDRALSEFEPEYKDIDRDFVDDDDPKIVTEGFTALSFRLVYFGLRI